MTRRSFSQRIDALAGDSSARLRHLSGSALDTELDPVLQGLVVELSAGLNMPIALVSLVLARTQYFRAHVGLPPDLAIARATDRDASFCQFVVRDSQRLEVIDATGNALLPQELVGRYGARAYIGQPIAVAGTVVGALCAIDAEPREFSDVDRALIETLAARVSARLEELAQLRTATPAALLSRAALPAFSELRNIVGPIEANVTMAKVSLADLGGLVRLATELPAEVVERMPAFGALDRAIAAFRDLTEICDDLERSAHRLMPMLAAIERLTTAERDATFVSDVVTTASSLALHHTKLVGGVRWTGLRPGLEVAVPRIVAVATVTSALSILAAVLKGRSAGIDASVDAGPAGVRIAMRTTGLAEDVLGAAAAELEHLIGASGVIQVAVAPDELALVFPAAGGRSR
ncbi:MAG: GAF domain-containing protein [Deltaproteobacteria bacterium]|nr:GAF domain-containing protein [Deltaproteobacteria bacterium]